MQKAKENAKKVMEKFIAFEIKEKSNYVSNEKQLRMIIDRAYETGISKSPYSHMLKMGKPNWSNLTLGF